MTAGRDLHNIQTSHVGSNEVVLAFLRGDNRQSQEDTQTIVSPLRWITSVLDVDDFEEANNFFHP